LKAIFNAPEKKIEGRTFQAEPDSYLFR